MGVKVTKTYYLDNYGFPIGDLINDYQQKNHVTNKQLAERMNLTTRTIIRAKHGQVTLLNLMEILFIIGYRLSAEKM